MIGRSLTVASAVATCALAPLVARAAEPEPRGESAQATIRIDTQPPDSHVYLRDAGKNCLLSVCTGWCTVTVSPGRFRIDAGLRHNVLRKGDGEWTAAAGEQVWLRVKVSDRHNRVVVGVVTALVGLTVLVPAGIVIATIDGGGGPLGKPDWSASSASVSIAGAVVLAGGLAFAAYNASAPGLDVERWYPH